MIPELGHFALIIAFCIAVVQGILPMFGAQKGIPGWVALAKPAALAQFLFVAIAFGLLAYAFQNNDFSVAYIANNSNSALPAVYRFAAIWGGHEGSLLLWMLMLTGWGAAVAVFSDRLPPEMVARVLAVMGLIAIGFMLFILFTSNPFDRLPVPPMDGRDLNPLLQDPGLVIHPPMLYMGYVGFSVAFAFALAALIGGRLDGAWARWSRPWTVVAWGFLTIGIALGSWWAYYELGWGGWWFWDPVENASFMPWLMGTALIHSLAVAEKRSVFKSWTVLLAIFTFSLSLLGTFLVRSGVLTSVHAFATDPTRGVFILGFLAVVVGGSLAIYAWRAPQVKSTGTFNLFSRESILLANNALLVIACISVLLGTLYPLLIDALEMGKISVGPPYFNSVFVPVMAPLVFLMALGPMVRWKGDSIMNLVRTLRVVFIVSLMIAVVAPWLFYGELHGMAVLGVFMGVWVTLATLLEMRRRVSNKSDWWQGMKNQPRSYYGMVMAHLGMVVCVIGITLTSHFSDERDLRMYPGEQKELGGYLFTFEGVNQQEGPNYTASVGVIRVSKNGKEVTVLDAEKRTYRVQTMPMTEAGIDTNLFRDLYVAIGDSLGDGSWAVRLYYKPFVSWIWLGGFLMAFGGFLAASDRRYRIARRIEKNAPEQVSTAAA